MAHEIGGRADKFGNRFELNWVLHQLLDVISEKKEYIIIEAIGDDEKGVDLWVGNLDGTREGQQCKSRHGSDESWTFSRINEIGIISNWKNQLSRGSEIQVSLVSPLSFTLLEDIIRRAKNCGGDYENFYRCQIKESGKKTIEIYKQYCKGMGIISENAEDLKKSVDYLSRTFYRQVPDTEIKGFIYIAELICYSMVIPK